ncbi:MAG: M48 family metalloprotease [Candidatus Obscuribacterales bacterium]|nr:M48 family metalloprotease [Candidatus Obscuribacterales bacterium]
MAPDDRTGWESTFKSGLDACSRYEYSKAQRFFNKALEEAHRENAVDHSIGEIFFNLGWCHQALHEYQAAEQRYKQSLATMERCHGKTSDAADRVANQIVELFRISNRSEQIDAFLKSRGQSSVSHQSGGISDQAAADLNALLSSGASRSSSFPSNSIAPGSPLNALPPGAVPSAYPQIQSSPPPAPSSRPNNSLTNMLTTWSRDQDLLPKSAPPLPSPRGSADGAMPPRVNSGTFPAPPLPSPRGPNDAAMPPRVNSGAFPAPPPPPPPGVASGNFPPTEVSPVVESTSAAPESSLPPGLSSLNFPPVDSPPRVLSGTFPAAEPPSVPDPSPPSLSTAPPASSVTPSSGRKKSDNGADQLGAPTAVKINRGPETSYQSAFVAGSMFSETSANSPSSPNTAVQNAPGPNPAALSTGIEVEDSSPSSRGEALQQQGRKVRNRFLATATGADDPAYDDLLAGVSSSQGPFDIERFVHPKEVIYRRLSIAIGCVVYFCMVISLVALVVAPLAALAAFIAHGLYLGGLRGSGIRVSNRQFPEVQQLLEEYCTVLRLEIPEVLVVHHEGILNAWAQRLHRKNLVIISADVLELAFEQGEKELAFVIVHELAHVRLGHTKWGWLHLPAAFVPFLGSAYSRACEYSCDRIARRLVPDGALFGLVALAAGKRLYRNVNLKALYEQAEEDWGFWTWFHEINASHPNLLNRIRAIGIADEAARRSLAALLIVGAAALLLCPPSSAQQIESVSLHPVSRHSGVHIPPLLIAEVEETAESDGEYKDEGGQADESATSSDDSEQTASDGDSTAGETTAQGESASSEPVSLAHLFMNALGIGLVVVVLLSIPIGFTTLMCAIIWKIGMVMRGGRKPDIG